MSDVKEFTLRVEGSSREGWVASFREMPGFTAEGRTRRAAEEALLAAIARVAEERGWSIHIVQTESRIDLDSWHLTSQVGLDDPREVGDRSTETELDSMETRIRAVAG